MASPNAHPSVSVILPVLNEEHHLRSAVTSVLSQSYPGQLEVLIALGPSKDKTNAVAHELANADARIKLVDNPDGRTTVGMNKCINLAKHDYIVRVDAHSELPEGYIRRGIEILLEVGADELGGIMDAKGRSAFQKAVAWAYTSRFGVGGASYHVGGEAGEAESAYMGIFKKSALLAVNGYDETIVRGEDWNLAQRIKSNGGLVWFTPELRVTYWPRGRFDRLVKQFWSTGVWRGDLTRRDIRGASIRYFAPPVLVLGLLAGLLFLAAGNVLGIVPLAAYLAAVAGLAVISGGLSMKSRVALVVALPTIHLSWGAGFIYGLLRGASKTIDRSRVTK
jgi:glycosyltransferase involved in cell wall biosynthesis